MSLEQSKNSKARMQAHMLRLSLAHVMSNDGKPPMMRGRSEAALLGLLCVCVPSPVRLAACSVPCAGLPTAAD